MSETVHNILDGFHNIGYTTQGSYGYFIHAHGKCWGEYRDLEFFNKQFALDWTFIELPKTNRKRVTVSVDPGYEDEPCELPIFPQEGLWWSDEEEEPNPSKWTKMKLSGLDISRFGNRFPTLVAFTSKGGRVEGMVESLEIIPTRELELPDPSGCLRIESFGYEAYATLMFDGVNIEDIEKIEADEAAFMVKGGVYAYVDSVDLIDQGCNLISCNN